MNADENKQTTGAEPAEKMSDLSAQAKEIGQQIGTKVADLGSSIAGAAKERATQVTKVASEVAGEVGHKAEDLLNDRRGVGADYLGSVAQAVDRAAGEFEKIPQAAQYIRKASSEIQGIADTIRDRDVGQLVGEVQDFARRQPALFFGGAMLLGFAAVRFLKSAPATSTAAEVQASTGISV